MAGVEREDAESNRLESGFCGAVRGRRRCLWQRCRRSRGRGIGGDAAGIAGGDGTCFCNRFPGLGGDGRSRGGCGSSRRLTGLDLLYQVI